MENPQQKDILKAFIKVGQTWTFGVEIDLKKKKKKHNPSCLYTFDSERNSSQSELCRERSGSKGRECITVRMPLGHR